MRVPGPGWPLIIPWEGEHRVPAPLTAEQVQRYVAARYGPLTRENFAVRWRYLHDPEYHARVELQDRRAPMDDPWRHVGERVHHFPSGGPAVIRQVNRAGELELEFPPQRLWAHRRDVVGIDAAPQEAQPAPDAAGFTEAAKLVRDALFLRMYGERPPGAPADDVEAETWREWDARAEAFLRKQPATPP